MMKRLVSIIIFILISLALLHLADVSSYYHYWRKNPKKISRRSYEKLRNFKALLENILEVERHNELYSEGKTTFKMRLNCFGEIPTSEFINRRNGYRRVVMGGALGAASRNNIPYRRPSDVSLPAEVDWRIQGAVTPIKDQGMCGSCWAFSAIASLETQLFIRSGQFLDLSEQHLVDCANNNYGNKGCNGGFMNSAYQYIQDNGGINTEDSYPYEARDGDCRATNTNMGTVRNFVSIQSGNETQLMEAVATVGPVAVAIDASRRSFQLYSQGVYYEPECSSTILDHGVLVIGYGTTADGLDYWILKNSYGDDWGENGFFRLARNRNNHCGIATDASYPLV